MEELKGGEEEGKRRNFIYNKYQTEGKGAAIFKLKTR